MSERPRFIDQLDFIYDDKPLHLGIRIVGGDGNYEQQPFVHPGEYDRCQRCQGEQSAAPSESFAREQGGRAARGKDHEQGPWCRRSNCTSHLAGPYTPEETK